MELHTKLPLDLPTLSYDTLSIDTSRGVKLYFNTKAPCASHLSKYHSALTRSLLYSLPNIQVPLGELFPKSYGNIKVCSENWNNWLKIRKISIHLKDNCAIRLWESLVMPLEVLTSFILETSTYF